MASDAKKIKALMKRMFTESLYTHRAYIRMYKKLPICDNVVLLESQHGTTLGGNIAKILQTLCEDEEFKDLKLYVTVRKTNEASLRAQWSSFKNSERIHAVRFDSNKYFRILASAGKLINDNTFLGLFIKKPGQLYLNTWHGTPLKTLGKGIKGERFAIGNAQSNFLKADLMLYPNEHTKNVIQNDYMIENFGTGRMAMTGYPRNEVFFSDETRDRMRSRFDMGSKRVFAYLPTWRGIVGKVNRKGQRKELNEIFSELDTLLPDDMLIYIKLHPVVRGTLNTANYVHIRTFPEDVPAYDFLQATDGLITDYSSIMFDYAVTHRPIILYTYDEEEYIEKRGLTFSLSELPFPRVKEIEELAAALDNPPTYDDSEFLKRFCPFEHVGVTKELMHNFISGDLSMYPEMPYNGKKNVIIYGGNFIRNGIVTALLNLLRNIDPEKFNYMVLYRPSPKTNSVRGYHEPSLDEIPDAFPTLGITNARCGTGFELLYTKVWKRVQQIFPKVPFRTARKAYENIARREVDKTFGMARIDCIIQYFGYHPEVIEMCRVMKCKRVIFIHSDMNRESKKTTSVPRKLLAHAYTEYDVVAPVTERMCGRTDYFIEQAGFKKRDYTVVPNIIAYKTILEQSKEELCFNKMTKSTVTLEELNEILASPCKKLINVGRFSYEKAHIRLIEAFEKEAADYKDAKLIILGSYGPDYAKTAQRAAASPLADRIILIRYLANPFPLVKQCDCLVLCSLYEGFGLVLAEADIVGIPCFSTRCNGPEAFMEKYHGMLVDNSREGLEGGIRAFLRGEIKKTLTVDYEEYNREAIRIFEDMVTDLTSGR